MKRFLGILVIAAVLFSFFGLASAGEQKTYTLIIKDHLFEPEKLVVPAGEKFKLIVENQDPTPEEFESDDLKREKTIQGNSTGILLIGPLEAGEYHFAGEFHEDTAKGVIVAEKNPEEEG